MSYPTPPSSYYSNPGPDMASSQPSFTQTPHVAPPSRFSTHGLYHGAYSAPSFSSNQSPSISTSSAAGTPSEPRARRTSVITTSEWKVSSSARRSIAEPKTYHAAPSSFSVDPRAGRRQSSIQPPVAPPFTPNSNSGYYAHATVSPQQADPRFHGQNFFMSSNSNGTVHTQGEPFVGGFVIPAAAVQAPYHEQNQHSPLDTYRQSSYYEPTSYYPTTTTATHPPVPPPPTSGPVPKDNASAAATEASTNSVNNLNKKPKDKLASGSKRQIRVRSIGEDYSVWIDISPKETGSTLAEKIHIIASRKTKKVASVTTAAGRKISLDRRPLFDGWDDLQKFQSGEEWQVEWCEQDRRLVDRLLSKVV